MGTMKRSFFMVLVIDVLVLFPIVLYGQGPGGEGDSMPANVPLVAQPLVPEGALATELVKVLKMGPAENEAVAEGILSAVGIEPRNGWIADYPVTPDIVGEIKEAVGGAAQAQRLPMGKEPALRAVNDLMAELGLEVMPSSDSIPVPAAPSASIYKYTDPNGVVHFTDRYESIPREYRDRIQTIPQGNRPPPAAGPSANQPSAGLVAKESEPEAGDHFVANPAPQVIYNYYYSNGPPVVTYYSPPPAYAYLYAWVPYSFYCYRYYFPGFFILYDFRRTYPGHPQGWVITNHFVHPRTKTAFRIDPVNRRHGGSTAYQRVTPPRFSSEPQAQAGARAIVNLSQKPIQPGKGVPGPAIRKVTPSIAPSGVRQPILVTQGVNPSPTKQWIDPRGASSNPAATRPAVRTGKLFPGPSTNARGQDTKGPRPSPREVKPSSPPVIQSSPRVAPRVSVTSANTENPSEVRNQHPRVTGPRVLAPPPPAAGGEFFHSTPSGRGFTPPSSLQNQGIRAPAGKTMGFGEGIRSGIGGSFGRRF